MQMKLLLVAALAQLALSVAVFPGTVINRDEGVAFPGTLMKKDVGAVSLDTLFKRESGPYGVCCHYSCLYFEPCCHANCHNEADTVVKKDEGAVSLGALIKKDEGAVSPGTLIKKDEGAVFPGTV